MSVVSLLGVQVMNNPAKFTDKYEFEITFECLEQLEKGESYVFPRSRPATVLQFC
jgi:ASF1-like histone chaperone